MTTDIITTLSTIDWTALFATISIIGNIILGYITKQTNSEKKTAESDKQALIDVSDPRKEQDAAQTKALELIDAESWHMSDATFNTLYNTMKAGGATVGMDNLRFYIDKFESEKRIDYGLFVFDSDGNGATEPCSAFINRGCIECLGTYNEISAICRERHAPVAALSN